MNRNLKYILARMGIVDEIARLGLSVGDRIPTERDLVGILPFSIITIRRALQDLEDAQIIERRPSVGNYLKSSIPKSPVSAHIGVLRILRHDRPHHSMPDLLSLCDSMQSRGIGVRYLESEVFNKSVLDTFADCLGLLLTDWISLEWIRHLRILDIPMLVIGPNPCPEEVPTVSHDWQEAAFRLTRHFLDTGRRKIGLINGERGWTPAEQIHSGYCRALREKGLEAEVRVIFPGLTTSHDEMIAFLAANPDFDALIVENQSAFLQSVWRMGSVPKLELGWINTGSNPEPQFPGVIATFPSPIMTFAGRIFLDHLVSQKPMPDSVSIPPSLLKGGRCIS